MWISQGWQEPYIYGVYTVCLGRETTKYTVIYGVYIRFWRTLGFLLALTVNNLDSMFTGLQVKPSVK